MNSRKNLPRSKENFNCDGYFSFKKAEFITLVLLKGYLTKDKEFTLINKEMCGYFETSNKVLRQWKKFLLDNNLIYQPKHCRCGETIKVKDTETGKEINYTYSYKFKKCKHQTDKRPRYFKLYCINFEKLRQYVKDYVGIDVIDNIDDYLFVYNNYITFKKKYWNTYSNNTTNKTEAFINENQYYLDIKAKLEEYQPKFICNYLKEEKLRLSHPICITAREDKESYDEYSLYRNSHARKDMLISLLGNTEFEEFDVNGSIYRLTYNLYHSQLLNNDVDIYNLIWNNCNFNVPLTDKVRNRFKKMIMPIYMRENAIPFKSNLLEQYELLTKKGLPIYDKKDREIYKEYNFFIRLTNTTYKEFQQTIQKAMHKVLNTDKFLQKYVFIQESNLFLLIRKNLMDRGIKTVNVYDGFYFIKGQMTQKLFDEIYNESVSELKNNLLKGIGSSVILQKHKKIV